jgi:hypothetical protein
MILLEIHCVIMMKVATLLPDLCYHLGKLGILAGYAKRSQRGI